MWLLNLSTHLGQSTQPPAQLEELLKQQYEMLWCKRAIGDAAQINYSLAGVSCNPGEQEAWLSGHIHPLSAELFTSVRFIHCETTLLQVLKQHFITYPKAKNYSAFGALSKIIPSVTLLQPEDFQL